MHELLVNASQGTSQTSLHNVVNLGQEPLKPNVSQTIGRPDSMQTNLVDLGQLVNLIDRIVLVVQRVDNDEHTHTGGP